MHIPGLNSPLLRLISAAGILLVALSGTAGGTPVANCEVGPTVCLIPDDVLLELPFFAIAGDAVLIESNGTTVSDVFRIFDNIVDTGSGTGIGDLAELYSADNPALPAIYSANAVFVTKNPSGATSYTNNGITYLLGVPEPRSLALLALGGGLFFLFRRNRRGHV